LDKIIGEFIEYFKYCKELIFEADPDYDYLIGLLKKILTDYCNNSDPDFDWDKSLKSNNIFESINTGKYKNKSMLMHNKSSNSHIFNRDETDISPGILKHVNSIFKIDE